MKNDALEFAMIMFRSRTVPSALLWTPQVPLLIVNNKALTPSSQGCQIFHDSSPNRVEMNVCDQLLEIPILLTKNRFVAILKKMSMPAVVPLKAGLKRTA